jgi:hypothetical protein
VRAATSRHRSVRATICPADLGCCGCVVHCCVKQQWAVRNQRGIVRKAQGAPQQPGTHFMILLVTFIATLFVADLFVIGISWVIEQFSKTVSLLVFLTLFLGVIPIAWRIAVRLTEPKGEIKPQSTIPSLT